MLPVNFPTCLGSIVLMNFVCSALPFSGRAVWQGLLLKTPLALNPGAPQMLFPDLHPVLPNHLSHRGRQKRQFFGGL